MGKKSSPPPPPAPDYTKMAEQTAASNQDAQTRADWANRPNQVTPWGTTSWESSAMIDPATGKPVTSWTQRESLTPEAQKALDSQMRVQSGLSGAAEGLIGRATDSFNQPFDISGAPKMTGIDQSQLDSWDNARLNTEGLPELADSGFGAVEQVRDAMMSRLQPDMDQARARQQQQGAARGLEEGGRAWQALQSNLGRNENDARQQALLGAMGAHGDIFDRSLAARSQGFNERAQAAQMAQGLRGQQFGEQVTGANLSGQQRQQAISEAQMLRNQPLNELTALMSGQQVQGLNMPGFNTSQSVGGTDYLGAGTQQHQDALSAYNAQQAAKAKKSGGMMSMIGTIGGSMLGGPIGGALGGALGNAIGGGGK